MWTRLILAGILAVAVAPAQRGGMGGGGMDGGPTMGGGMDRGGLTGHATGRLDLISDTLKLDKDQKKKVKTIMDDGQKEATPVKDQMIKARMAIAEAVAAGKGKDEIDKAAAAYAAAEARMHQIELTAFAKIYQALEKDQQAKVRPVFAMMSGIFKGRNWNEMN
jgi:Spy/CpxP family protein refolding chaperone